LIVAGHDKEVAAWVASRTPYAQSITEAPHTAIGIARDGELIGGVVYTHFSNFGPNAKHISMHVAGVGNWLTKGALFEFFHYPFKQLGCNLILGIVPKKSKKVRKFDEKVGFVMRGVLPGYFPGDDACIYTMNPDQCRWIQ
jgi:RimJ/RimL family protein N-acetyltransferase